MEQTQIEQKLTDVLSRISLVDETEIHANSRLGADLGMDSLDLAELAIEIEDTFEVSLDDDAPDKWITVANVLTDVTEHPAVKAIRRNAKRDQGRQIKRAVLEEISENAAHGD